MRQNEQELENYFIEQLESEGGKFIKSDDTHERNPMTRFLFDNQNYADPLSIN